jgi:hypothetical protein
MEITQMPNRLLGKKSSPTPRQKSVTIYIDDVYGLEHLLETYEGLPSGVYKFQDQFNPLHYYCRLIEAGMPKHEAKIRALIYRILYDSDTEYFKRLYDGTKKQTE